MLVVFSPIFVADTNITFVYNFVAPLSLADFLNKIIYQTYLFYEFMQKDDLNVHVFQNRN